MIPLNDLRRSSRFDSPEVLQQIERLISNGAFILGEQVSRLESSLAGFIGVPDVVAVASGTDALTLALRSLGIKAGDHVATTANAGSYSTIAAKLIGAKPVYVDSDPMGRMDPARLEDLLAGDTQVRVVILTHLFGLAGPLATVRDVCDRFGVLLVEDCAQSFGASANGRMLGSVGDASTFSFYPTKNLGAMGDAGAVASPHRVTTEKARKLRQYGWGDRYRVELEFGFNSRMDEFQALVLNNRLSRIGELNEARVSIWKKYNAALAGSEWMIIGEDSASFVAHLGVVVSPPSRRDSARTFFENSGISTGIHYPILDYQQPAFVDTSSTACPVSEDLVSRIFTIPLFPEMTEKEISRVVAGLNSLSAGDF